MPSRFRSLQSMPCSTSLQLGVLGGNAPLYCDLDIQPVCCSDRRSIQSRTVTAFLVVLCLLSVALFGVEFRTLDFGCKCLEVGIDDVRRRQLFVVVLKVILLRHLYPSSWFHHKPHSWFLHHSLGKRLEAVFHREFPPSARCSIAGSSSSHSLLPQQP